MSKLIAAIPVSQLVQGGRYSEVLRIRVPGNAELELRTEHIHEGATAEMPVMWPKMEDVVTHSILASKTKAEQSRTDEVAKAAEAATQAVRALGHAMANIKAAVKK